MEYPFLAMNLNDTCANRLCYSQGPGLKAIPLKMTMGTVMGGCLFQTPHSPHNIWFLMRHIPYGHFQWNSPQSVDPRIPAIESGSAWPLCDLTITQTSTRDFVEDVVVLLWRPTCFCRIRLKTEINTSGYCSTRIFCNTCGRWRWRNGRSRSNVAASRR